jgi:hypothetical protein
VKWFGAQSRSVTVTVVGTALMIPYFLMGDTLLAGVYWDVCLGALMGVAFWFAWRLPTRRAPWLLIVGGQFLFLAGDFTWILLDHVFEHDAYPNVGDVFYIS